MKVGIFVWTWNESHMLPQFVAHYRRALHDAQDVVFHVFDNQSTDGTRAIARRLGCRVRLFVTDGLRDDVHATMKSEVWKRYRRAYDWVLTCDCDEFVDVSVAKLAAAAARGYALIRPAGYNMVGRAMARTLDVSTITRGVRARMYDKPIVFRPDCLLTNDFTPGAHSSTATAVSGTVKTLRRGFKLRHYKYLNLDYVIRRYADLQRRRSPLNLERSWGFQYAWSPQQISEDYALAWKKARAVPG